MDNTEQTEALSGNDIADRVKKEYNLDFLTRRKEIPQITIIIPIIIDVILAAVVALAASSERVIMLGENALPVSAFAGVLSSLGNIFLILMVVFYRKLGLIVSVALILLQFPMMIMGIVARHSLSTIPGVFTNILTIITLLVIYNHQKRLDTESRRMQLLFEQTATALVNAIDAKDKYTHGHSSRVADYSRKLAEMNYKSEEECDEIYYAALLHDVGKIGIPVKIINKKGRLTDEEYEVIKQHPLLGSQILENISEHPYLSVGAHYHHERYDGKGYPEGLKGTEIPELARIISVADAYDAMTSKRSYRDPIPQQKVREEIVKGTGSQFDPEYARLMLHLIDMDTEYEMKERESLDEFNGKDELVVGEHRSAVSEGILINSCMTTIKVSIGSFDEAAGITPAPSLILFDAVDGKVYSDESKQQYMGFFEYGEIWFDGTTVTGGARKMQTEFKKTASTDVRRKGDYKIDAVRLKDHAFVRITGKDVISETTIALPDSTRYFYIGLTGEHCRISGLKVVKRTEEIPASYITRIAEEISYIDVPAGNIPNVQIDNYRSAHSEGIKIRDGLKESFHTESLPTAKLVWHCPFVNIYCSEDGRVNGRKYRELAFMRFDGECWECDKSCMAELDVKKTGDFKGWDEWKAINRQGYDALIGFAIEDNKIIITTENAGVYVKNTIIMTDIEGPVYASLTGDQCALTNIIIN